MQQHGVPIERYFVTTDDGYILGLYHLPQLLSSSVDSRVSVKPIFFMHGQVSSSQDFIAYRNSSAGESVLLLQFVHIFAKNHIFLSQYKQQNSILFLGSWLWCLARYEIFSILNWASLTADVIVVVVAGNARGNTFSRNYTTLNPDDEDFWQFR